MGFSTQRVPRVAALAVSIGVLAGCAGVLRTAESYQYFARPAPDDPWSRKIAMWQLRERAGGADVLPTLAAVGEGAEPSAPAEADLATKYQAFRHERKRAMARDVAEWIQRQARDHYRPDGPIDHWATLEETLRANGDDCDGLELLVYHALRDLGFGNDEVYRAIVYRRNDGQHHMVTFWFEDADDPWVIDPTGAMTSGMPRMSEIPGWVPLKVFSEDEDFTVHERTVAQSRLR